ncbi:MAG: ABC transporter substrate-binding protein, partial [Flavobacteriales bacterium]|nr:ABC transporter substrate-binding protein [Flavobacteriales bacterium]
GDFMGKITTLVFIIFTFFSCTENQISKDKLGDEYVLHNLNKYIGESDEIADKRAVIGGSIKTWGSAFPKTLNAWLNGTHFSSVLMGLMFEPLFTLHSTQNKVIGNLAESWIVSKDKKTYTFKIRDFAKWSDGTDITSEDFQFYYDVIMNPTNLTPVSKIGLKRFNRPVIINKKSFSIKAKDSHWQNFYEAGGLVPFPKHVWSNVNFNKINFEFPVTCGPYYIKELKKNRYLYLEKMTNWWGEKLAYNRYKFNLKSIKYKFMNDRNKALEALKKGDFDVYSIYTSSLWVKQTHFKAVNKGWVSRERIFNKEPIGFQGFAVNLRKKRFQDKRVRIALSKLLDRRTMNKKLMYDQYFLLNCYYPDLYKNNINPKVTLVEFDPDGARKLFKEAGWLVNDKGHLEKNGEIFKIKIMAFDPDVIARHLNIYSQALKKVGIVVDIQQLSMATIRKKIDKRDFDLHWSAWGAGRLKNPESLWFSEYADKESSYNISGIKNKKIDALIEKQKTIMDIEKRNKILREIDTILAEEIPYILLWQNDNHRLLSWNKYGRPKYVFDKYGSEASIITYWWQDAAKLKLLNQNRKENLSVSMRDVDIHYQP